MRNFKLNLTEKNFVGLQRMIVELVPNIETGERAGLFGSIKTMYQQTEW
jgi:hypothetical protein